MPWATRIWSSVRSPTRPTLSCPDPAVVDAAAPCDAARVRLASIEEPVLVRATTGGRWSDPRNRFLGVPRIVCWTGMRRAVVALTESISRVAAGLGALLRGAEDLPVGVEAVPGGLHVGAGRVLGAGGLAVVPVAVLGDHHGQVEGGEAVDEIPLDLHLLLREVEVSRADALVGAALGFDVVEQVVVDHHERGAGPAVTQLDPFGELRACGAADGAAGDPGDAELLDPVLGDQVELVGVPGDRDRRVLVRPGPAGQGVLDRGAAELLPELLQPDHIGGARRAGGARRRRC